MNIYIGNLGNHITNDSLNAIFSTYGTVLSSKVVRNHKTGISRGFGFIEMIDNSEGEYAIDKINGSVLDGQTVIARRAKDSRQSQGNFLQRLRGY
jgi:RNA recognition motif-containing protein